MPPRSPLRRLLAVDLDGTLVRTDGIVDARDRAALVRARAAGAAVTLASGRLSPTVVALARELDLDTPLLCADGAALVCPRTGSVLESTALAAAPLAALLDALASHGLVPFLGFPGALVGEAGALAHAVHLRGWSSAVLAVSHLAGAAALHRDVPVLALGLGPRARVEAAHASAARALGATAELASFTLGEGAPWALRAQPPGVSKGAALARLAARRGVPRRGVAAVGDWLNDLSMLAWAGRSFAMGQSPEVLRRTAQVVLEATATTGGGVAEAVERWLGEAPPGGHP